MNTITRFIIILLLTNCNPSDSSKNAGTPVTDTAISNPPPNSFQSVPAVIKHKEKIDTTTDREIDTVLFMNISEEILNHIKTRNYKKFALFIHPKDSIRFSPYANIDTTKDRVLSSDQFLQLAKQKKEINWNSSWDAEKPELLNIDGYFKKFVYDVDFLNADLISINQYHSQGTDLNNINEAYPGCDVVEFFFSGFEEKYEGLDFRALRLVYNIRNNKIFLVGIVHDEWTP